MVRARYGRIAVIGSLTALQANTGNAAYAASKAALDKYVFDMAPHLKGSGVCMNLLDPGWLRTDLGGPRAPSAVESVLPGALAPVLLDDGSSGKLFRAQEYSA
jgi:NAD(P)-dependent dehydrogenase (short-subunit alcohol dehydrogenase family)